MYPSGPEEYLLSLLLRQDPGIKAMAEQLARDPSFAQMTQSLQAGFGRDGPGSAAAGAGPAMDPETAAQAMSGMFQNPDFMHMAQELGQKIMSVRFLCASESTFCRDTP